MAKRKRKSMGFKQALTYVLDLLCYAYYVKNDSLVSDEVFDDLERLYMTITGENNAPCRAMERAVCYSTGVVFMYDYIKAKKEV